MGALIKICVERQMLSAEQQDEAVAQVCGVPCPLCSQYVREHNPQCVCAYITSSVWVYNPQCVGV